MKRPIAISDSANFYVSAERIFDPTLANVPVIVLSNNDGCAVARSDEARSSPESAVNWACKKAV